MPTLALNIVGALWHRIPDEDPYAARFSDAHYSRQTPGARGILAPGFRGLWWHEGPRGSASVALAQHGLSQRERHVVRCHHNMPWLDCRICSKPRSKP